MNDNLIYDQNIFYVIFNILKKVLLMKNLNK